MSTSNAFLSVNYDEFFARINRLSQDPQVKINVGDRTFQVSKTLLCEQSPYFKAMFEGSFKEGEEQATTLEKMDGVISERSVGMLLQWMLIGRVECHDLEGEDKVTCAVEFARIADMFEINGTEKAMADLITETIKSGAKSPRCINSAYHWHTRYISTKNVESAVLLPNGHPVRKAIAEAALRGYLTAANLDHIPVLLQGALNGNAGFVSDFVKELKTTLLTMQVRKDHLLYAKDRFSNEKYLVVTRINGDKDADEDEDGYGEEAIDMDCQEIYNNGGYDFEEGEDEEDDEEEGEEGGDQEEDGSGWY